MRNLTLVLTIIGFILLSGTVFAESTEKTEESSYVGKLFGKKEDFTFLKKRRRDLNNEINNLERNIPDLERQKSLLTEEQDEPESQLAEIDSNIQKIDLILSDKKDGASESVSEKKEESLALSLPLSIRMRDPDFFNTLTKIQLSEAKNRFEKRKKSITEQSIKINQLAAQIASEKRTLDEKREELTSIEENISSALDTRANQYVYRTVVSLIFAAIVFYLVSRFFAVIKDSEEIKKTVFLGDNGIQFITLFSIVIAVILFGILEILGANELSALLGGLSGYILGKSKNAALPLGQQG